MKFSDPTIDYSMLDGLGSMPHAMSGLRRDGIIDSERRCTILLGGGRLAVAAAAASVINKAA